MHFLSTQKVFQNKNLSINHVARNGKLSIFVKDDKDKKVFPLPLILDSIIQEDNLKYINKNKEWVINILNNKKIHLNDVFYAFYKNDEIYIIKKDD